MAPDQEEDRNDLILIETDSPGPRTDQRERRVRRKVIGQEIAVERALETMEILDSGLNDPHQPAGVMIFAGPKAVGKTLMAKVLSYVYLDVDEDASSEYPATFVQCANFREGHTLSTLLGSPPGYVGSRDQGVYRGGLPLLHQSKIDQYHFLWKARRELREVLGQDQGTLGSGDIPEGFWVHPMTAMMRSYYQPFRSVIIFDEIERAHPDVHDFLLDVFEEGFATLRSGERVNFGHSLIILTTNIGTREIHREMGGGSLGFHLPQGAGLSDLRELRGRIYHAAERAIARFFDPAFVSRLADQIIVFTPLTLEDFRKILTILLRETQEEIARRCRSANVPPIVFSCTRGVGEFLVQEGIRRDNGQEDFDARLLRSKVRHYIRGKIARALSCGELRGGDVISFKMHRGKPQIFRHPRPEGTEFPPIALEEPEKPPIQVTARRIPVRPPQPPTTGDQ